MNQASELINSHVELTEDMNAFGVMQISRESTTYNFFRFITRISNIMLFDKNYNPDPASNEFKIDLNIRERKLLQSVFKAINKPVNSIVLLSGAQLKQFIFMMEQIAIALLSPESDRLKEVVSAKFPSLKNNWENNFFENARFSLNSISNIFKTDPQYLDVVEMVSERLH